MYNNALLHKFWTDCPAWLRVLCLIIAGAIAGFGQAPFDMPALTLLGLGFGIWAARYHATQSLFVTGWALGVGYFGMTLYWLIQPFLVDPAKTGWMAPFALAAMSGGLAMFWGVAFRLVKGPYGMLLTLSLAAAEFARAYLFSGFPWVLLGYVWIDTPVYQLASIIGPHGMTLLTVFYAYMVARARFFLALFILALAIVFQVLPTPNDNRDIADRPMVRLIHPNVLQQDKWDPDKREGIYQRQLDLTQAAPPVQLVVWPETSVYLPLHIVQSEIAAISNGARVLVGVQRRSEERLYYNSLGVIGPTGEIEATYDKYRLVPFGEFIPFGEILGKFGLRGLAAKDGAGFAPGVGPAILDVVGIGRIQPLICYEGIFPQDVGNTSPRPDVIVLITNDAWFGTFQGPSQHLAQARARAIELGVPVIRVANRGVSAVIDARGDFDTAIGVEATGYVDAPIPLPLSATIYARFRDIPALLFAFLLLIGALRRPSRIRS